MNELQAHKHHFCNIVCCGTYAVRLNIVDVSKHISRGKPSIPGFIKSFESPQIYRTDERGGKIHSSGTSFSQQGFTQD